MPLINTTIPNLIGGISQQPDRLKFEGQCSDSLNCHASTKDGLIKRSELSYVARYGDISTEDSLIFPINRSLSERYMVCYNKENGLNVFNVDTGELCTVTGDTTYLDCGDITPSSGIKHYTISDYTFLTNTTTKVSKVDAIVKSSTFVKIGLFIKQGDFNKGYRVTINGIEYNHYTGSNTTASAANSDVIAKGLRDALNAGSGTIGTLNGWKSRGDVVYAETSPFPNEWESVYVSDSLSGRGLGLIYESVEDITELPIYYIQGHKVRVSGDSETGDDDYYVKFQADNETLGDMEYGKGSWVETLADDIDFALEKNSMPHALVNTGFNTFEFRPFDWSERTVGDDNTNPFPSLVGARINDIFLFKDRLGFIYDNSVLMSEAGNYSNFFRNTVISLLDSTPIDVVVGGGGFVSLRSAVPTTSRLILFSDREQFALKGDELLTNATVSITQITNFESDILIKPRTLGRYTYFLSGTQNSVLVREMYLDNLVNDFDTNIINSHSPTLIPFNVKGMSGSSGDDQIIITITGSNEYFLYTYHWQGNEKKISSWSRHTIDCDYIVGAEFIDGDVYVIVNNNNDTQLLRGRFNKDPKNGVYSSYRQVTTLSSLRVYGMENDTLNGLYVHTGQQHEGYDLLRHEDSTNLVIRYGGGNDNLARIWQLYDETATVVKATSMIEATYITNNYEVQDVYNPYQITLWNEK